MLLQDKVVIISGIGPGLGIKLALEAARQGGKLVLAARTAAKLAEAEQEIRAEVPTCEVLQVPTDISNREQAQALAAAAEKHFGRIDVLINSAYNGGNMAPFEQMDLQDWEPVFRVNVFGTLALTQAVIPAMKRQGGGSIVMINTMVAHKPMPANSAYGASKAALANATAHLALELGEYGIRVNSVYMGWMWGPNVAAYVDMQSEQSGVPVEEIKAGIASQSALRIIPEDGECAKPAIFLASDYAGVVTGASLDVNGGAYIPH